SSPLEGIVCSTSDLFHAAAGSGSVEQRAGTRARDDPAAPAGAVVDQGSAAEVLESWRDPLPPSSCCQEGRIELVDLRRFAVSHFWQGRTSTAFRPARSAAPKTSRFPVAT